ncbi:MAG: AAA family ATPase [Smithellaceae bacterium]
MYRKFFGFKEKPFEITPDPSYVYLSEAHQEGLSYLQYAIKERKGFSVITGEAGTGKTTLVHKLLSNLDGNVRTCYIFNPVMDKSDFLNYICHDLGIPTEDLKTRGQSLSALHNFLLSCFTRDEKVFLIVDEAQCLDPDLLQEVRLLTNLETAKYKLLHVVLLGQPELTDILNKPEFRPLKQRITVRFDLRTLRLGEVRKYINYRLKRAGSRNINLFNDSAVRAVYKYSQGIPRLINILCDNALLTGFSQSKTRIDAGIIKNTIHDMEGMSQSKKGFFKDRKLLISLMMILCLLALTGFFFSEPITELWRKFYG